jgi:hypothetical protein
MAIAFASEPASLNPGDGGFREVWRLAVDAQDDKMIAHGRIIGDQFLAIPLRSMLPP